MVAKRFSGGWTQDRYILTSYIYIKCYQLPVYTSTHRVRGLLLLLKDIIWCKNPDFSTNWRTRAEDSSSLTTPKPTLGIYFGLHR